MRHAAVKNTSKTFSTVVVDAGHAEKINGAYRRFGGAEKIATLDVAQRLDRKLRESQMKTVMTRSSDVFISLDERVASRIRKKNAIFVSIHFNDSRRRGIHGFADIYHSGDSFDLANRIQGKLIDDPALDQSRRAHGEFPRSASRVLSGVLVECGFLSNRSEGSQARDWEYRELLADRIAEAIVEQRYGPGVYRGSPQVTAQTPQAETPTGLTPDAAHH